MFDIRTWDTPFSADKIQSFTSLTEIAFGNKASRSWIEGLNWRLENMPDISVFVALQNNILIGYKAGYATAYHRYYSWLGCVAPNHQRQGVGQKLMTAQHDWLQRSRFRTLETQVSKTNTAMINLNLENGFKILGEFHKQGEPYLILEKQLQV